MIWSTVCVEMSIIIAQGLPECPHHVLGNLWIKIAEWLKRSDLSKHKQSGLTNMVDWLWFARRPRTAPGASRVLLGATLGSFFTKLKRGSIAWRPSHCLCTIRVWLARCLVHIALFSINQHRLCCESHCCLCRDWFAVVEVVNGGRALISSQLPAPSPLSSSFSHRSGPVLSSDRCLDKR